MHIAIAGMAIECCTFSPLLTSLSDFTLWRGDALLGHYCGATPLQLPRSSDLSPGPHQAMATTGAAMLTGCASVYHTVRGSEW
jgi:microcystin degradation protein MlrC